jgi:hypothetical protein
MVAGALSAAGYHMGDLMLPASVSNPRGYFEDREVNDLNEDLLLEAAPLRPSGRVGVLFPRRLPYGYRWLAVVAPGTRIRAAPELAARMQACVSRRPFCLKDPRFCYTLEAWRPALGDAAFICVFREPGRTATSVVAAARNEREYLAHVRPSSRRALAVWSAMYRHVLDTHRLSGDWAFIHYDQLLDGSAIPHLEALLDARIDAGFADPKLKRSADDPDVSKEASALYRRLCSLAQFEPPASPARAARVGSGPPTAEQTAAKRHGGDRKPA